MAGHVTGASRGKPGLVRLATRSKLFGQALLKERRRTPRIRRRGAPARRRRGTPLGAALGDRQRALSADGPSAPDRDGRSWNGSGERDPRDGRSSAGPPGEPACTRRRDQRLPLCPHRPIPDARFVALQGSDFGAALQRWYEVCSDRSARASRSSVLSSPPNFALRSKSLLMARNDWTPAKH